MQEISNNGKYIIRSSFGSSIYEGTLSDRSAGSGASVQFDIIQINPVYRSFFWQIEPVTGQTSDFWNIFFSNKIGGEPANQFALSGFGTNAGGSGNQILLNADNVRERDEQFAISFYVSNLDPFSGVPPVARATFTILNDDGVTFRFFHTQAGGHLFTTSAVEAASVRANLPHYRDEGVAFLTADASVANAVPVFRFFHTQAGGHLFTTSAVEADAVRANLPHYRDEGVGFHMSATAGEGLAPIYRFFHTQAGGHLFTSSEVEAANVRATLPVYRDEGIAFYAPTRIADELFG
ncbi:hypothetical protein [Sabulicella glaciei]|uniref:DUF5648 domain-containing protein n=1 Tax=Sabulicella glaciei TaxID=2984948 RepID=A0ABT3NZR6_9PROT|nr:hypothetical protein [Roseococcus sp. MDT2-1-1]MCW8087663.1 hypothetical protein [Roseococcus sp. MDT2-1-1]